MDYEIPSSSTTPIHKKGHHRRTSSLWIPPSRPSLTSPGDVLRQKADEGGRAMKNLIPSFAHRFFLRNDSRKDRMIHPNNQPEPPPRYLHPNRKYADNRINTTKYNLLTFLPKNLFEQFHRSANLYFIFIVVLNMLIEAFGRYISMLPIAFVLCVSAVKDAFEDYRRYKSDQKINHIKCRVWDSSQGRYRKMEWKNILVGDFVHLSHDEIIPADLLLLKSSDPSGICYVETSNLDGENNLKQRHVARAMAKFHSSSLGLPFSPALFNYNVVVEAPCTDVYKVDGRLEAVEGASPVLREQALINKDNVLLRGCVVRNTDYVEGIVLYAGADTKAMLNNRGPRYKRSKLERLTNWDIIWCVLILLLLCTTGAVLSGVWLASFSSPFSVPFLAVSDAKPPLNPAFEAFRNFWSFIIVLQVMIPISLYVSIEIIKLGQTYFLSQDALMYFPPSDKRIQCRALNIPEELGQVEYVMSDKTGTLTENDMVFRRCSVDGTDYGGMPAGGPGRSRHCKDSTLETRLTGLAKADGTNSSIFAFFLSLAICNTVVVNAKPHEDMMDDFGDIIGVREDDKWRQEKSLRKRGSPPLSVQFIQEMDEEKDKTVEMEEIELVEFSVYQNEGDGEQEIVKEVAKELGDKEDNAKEAKKEEGDEGDGEKEKAEKLPNALQSILSTQSRSSLLSFARLKGGLKEFTPFRRSVDRVKRCSLLPEVPPPVSFYDSESPDELALVNAAKEYGLRLMRRQFDEVTLHVKATGRYIKYKVLHTLPFDADRKRMSVLVRPENADGKVLLLCKGADSAILGRLDPLSSSLALSSAQQHLSDYARSGLRTLCMARRWLSESEYTEWRSLHEEAEFDPHHSENLLRESYDRIERDLEILGVTAIEDRLQDGVAECIESLREAGIRVWVLTGDKVETAVNIAYSSRLFSQTMDILSMSSTGVSVVSDLLDLYLARVENVDGMTPHARFGVVLSASSLEYCLAPSTISRFCRLLSRSDAVLCCRATPLQKASLVRLAKSSLHANVLAIGDGANDVSMIQGADVGVGLSGQEGMQAVMAADYALGRFRFLARLLLVHGHWCYHRLASVILYFFYKNAMFVFCIFWYQIFNGFSSQVPIDPIYLMVYNFLFTSLPSLLFGFMEQDASAEVLIANPSFYEHGRLGKNYRWYSFWLNIADAAWQSAVVYFLAHFTYLSSECDMWTFGVMLCTQLLIVNSLHLVLIVQYWTWPLLTSIALSLAAFFSFAMVYNLLVSPQWGVKDTPALVAEMAVLQPRFWLLLLLSAVTALLPRFLWVVLRNSLVPSRLLLASIEENSRNSARLLSCLRVKQEKRLDKCVHSSSMSSSSANA